MNKEALSDQDWEAIYKRLTLYAYHRLKRVGIVDMETAQDMAQEAVRRLFDPEYADWDQDREPVLLRYLGSTVNGMVSNLRRKRTRRSERLLGDMPAQGERFASVEPSVEQRLLAHEALNQAVGALRLMLKEDDLAQQVLEQMLRGRDRPADQAEALGVEVQQIYRARRRLKLTIDALREKADDATRAQAS